MSQRVAGSREELLAQCFSVSGEQLAFTWLYREHGMNPDKLTQHLEALHRRTANSLVILFPKEGKKNHSPSPTEQAAVMSTAACRGR